jgi:predicted anti-sigma-YlaC factor YlaD
MRCRKFEARLEDYLGGAPDSEVQHHLDECAACRAALEDSRLGGELLREALEPSNDARPVFLAGVMVKIREEKARAESPAAFWTPLEFLASRLALTAAVLLLALSAYLVDFAPRRNAAQFPGRTELSASDFPQPPGDPVSNDEVLQSLAERNDGR